MSEGQECDSFSQGAKGTEGFKKKGISHTRGNSEVQNGQGWYFF